MLFEDEEAFDDDVFDVEVVPIFEEEEEEEDEVVDETTALEDELTTTPPGPATDVVKEPLST